MGLREYSLAPFNHAGTASVFDQLHHLLRGEREECRLEKICLRMHMLRKLVPLRHIRKIAAPLSAYHDLASYFRHLFQNDYPGPQC